MESMTWFLTFAVLAGWLAVGLDLLRRPPEVPARLSPGMLRMIWGSIWVGALVVGIWGPPLWSTTSTSFSDEPGVGEPAELSSLVIRTPFAVQATSIGRDANARQVHREDRLTLQLPVGLLAFFVLIFVIRRREDGAGGGGGAAKVAGSAAVVLLMAGCGADSVGRDAPRPDREITQARWDTLVHLEVNSADTLLYSADDVAVSPAGIWVMDRIGFRVAHFGWDGDLRWYAGGRGAGPGEFVNPRVIDLDAEDRVWVMDLGTNRITGYDAQGELAGELNLAGMEGALHDFWVNPAGDRFYGMLMRDGLYPVEVHIDGSVEEGQPLRIPDADGIFGIALQGRVAGSRARERWAYALTMGDGLFRMEGLEAFGGRILFPEWVPFPTMIEEVTKTDAGTTTSRRLGDPNFSASGVAVAADRILVPFRGSTEDAGRLVEIFEFETGEYVKTLRLPHTAVVAAWDDRLVLVRNSPVPSMMVIRPRNGSD